MVSKGIAPNNHYMYINSIICASAVVFHDVHGLNRSKKCLSCAGI